MMSCHAPISPVCRAALLAAGTAGAAVTLVLLGTPAIARTVGAARSGRQVGFVDLLVSVCDVVAVTGCVALLLVLAGVLHELRRGRVRSTGSATRRFVLAACGLAVVATATPAHAAGGGSGDPGRSAVVGLPLPDRAVGGSATGRSSAPEVVHVGTGDSLWSISARHLGPGASNRRIAAYWQQLYARNADVVGDDPDRILPGQVLHLPPARYQRS